MLSVTIDYAAIKAASRHNWRMICANLGIELPDGPKKHGPCPACGGEDRFRFDDEGGRGSWFCNQCEPKAGDGFALVQNVKQCDFKTAAGFVDDALGNRCLPPHRPHMNGSTTMDGTLKHAVTRRQTPPDGELGRTLFCYEDADGSPGFYVQRIERPDGKKVFPQWGPTEDGTGWQANMDYAPKPRPLYRLPHLLAHPDALVVLHEGEKAVHAHLTASLTGIPTTTSQGAEKAKWTDFSPLVGRHVVICPDHDEPGERHAQDVAARAQAGGAASVRIFRLTGLPAKGDVVDWLENGGTPDAFSSLLEFTAQTVLPSQPSTEAAVGPHLTEAIEEPLANVVQPDTAPPGRNGHPALTVQSADPDDVPHPIEWPGDPPIALEAPVLPAFPTDVLPPWLNDMAQAVARHTETPIELPALIGLGVLATCCQRTFVIQPKPDYLEPLNVWTVVALESGNRKTSVMQHMTKPLRDADRERCEASKAEMLRIETERENIKARVKSLRGRLTNGDSEDSEDIEREIHKWERSLPEAPSLPRLWVQDITPEKLGQTLAENGERLAIVSDEGGVFDIMAGRYSNGVPNLDVYLQSHAGGAVRVDRGNRPPVMMNHPALTIALSPQPDVLRGLTEKPGFRSRGLLARFLYALPASPLGYRTLHNIPIPPAVETAYRTQLLSILNMQPPCNEFGEVVPFILRMTDASYQEWHEFAQEVETNMRDEGPHEHIRDWAGKLPGAAARLAGLFHCAKHAQGQPWTMDVELETVQMALALTAILTTHALAAFDMMGADPALGAARKVWRWIRAGQRKIFTARDCFQALRSTFPRMIDLNPAFEVLFDRGYLHELPDPKKGRGKPGRRTRILAVNPILMEGWS